MTTSTLLEITKTFGRDGLVLVMVLVIWFGMAQPEIARNAITQEMIKAQNQQFRAAIEELKQVSQQNAFAAQVTKTTAESLERTVDKLNQ